ncbi:MAG: ROK family protein [Candidatus Heimdallarchaeota archaeon]|nr:ROK family protein [Candidatus Heimdallarchaeota archaeon]
MSVSEDKRVVVTLDAGGTNFVFSAIQGNKAVIEPIHLPSVPDDLSKCLNTITDGFQQAINKSTIPPVAISFAFPGPADYPNGIIGDLPNLPAFRGGVALGPFLESKFNLPVFINNDGDLYAYGEAIAGFLPYINQLLDKAGSPKQFNNLVGFTLGTGIGAGIVRNGELFIGDNSGAGEVWLLRNKLNPEMNVEEGVSIRAVQREYAKIVGIPFENVPTPKDIFEIATGNLQGNKEAAINSYSRMGEVLGDAIANVLTLIDGIAVIGGGVAGASSLFFPKMIEEMNANYKNSNGDIYRRLIFRAFNLEDDDDMALFKKGDSKEITVPGSSKKVLYDPMGRVGVGISKIGTSKAVALGAYAFALNKLS